MPRNKIIIAIYVDNQYGVLSRVTAMFTRREKRLQHRLSYGR